LKINKFVSRGKREAKLYRFISRKEKKMMIDRKKDRKKE
jgi:ribosomal protein L24E